MFSTDDTIVAIATPPGRGGIGVVRLSGPGAAAIARRSDRRATRLRAAPRDARTHGHAAASRPIDRAVVTHLPRAAFLHRRGRRRDQRAWQPGAAATRSSRAAMAAGARLAEPGEFTLRAFLHGRIDLVQAEAVAI